MTGGEALSLAAVILPFAVSVSVSPGPNNLMVTASAANFGIRRTVPHMLGIVIGFPAMLIAVGLGLARIFATYPELHRGLKIIGAAYLLFLAWKIATSGRSETGAKRARPLNFGQAALFQWVNPKAWVVAVGVVTTYTTIDGELTAEVLVIAAIFAALSLPTSLFWATIGATAARFLATDGALRVFNFTMAALLVASLAALFF